ncbi:MAG: hypothetical protein WC488_01800 [Candidatus Micrarchaeia archaeon]
MIRNLQFNQRLLLSIALISGFVLLVLAMLMSYILASSGSPPSPLVDLLFRYHFEMMLLVSVLGIVVGASVYFLMHQSVEIKSQESKFNANLLLNFLSREEKAAIEYLVQNEGHTTQSQISRLEGMTRLRAHRLVLRLVEKKIIRLEKLGKTNQLWLAPEIYEALRKPSSP